MCHGIILPLGVLVEFDQSHSMPQLRYLPRDKREEIIKEIHSSAIGGHRVVTKTYNRIRQHYFTENMKLYNQNLIQQCLQCKLKKCGRIKAK